MNTNKVPAHSHLSHPPLHIPSSKKEGRLKTHHKHALRIMAWLGVLALMVGGFASARTSFFGLFEKNVDDHTLAGLVSESLVHCDATGKNCDSEPSRPNSLENCDVTGNCPEEKEEDCQDPTGNCLPEPSQAPQTRFEARKPTLAECDDPTGNCPEPSSGECDATGKNCDSEPSRPNSLENCDVTGNCPEEKEEDCQDPTGNCSEPKTQDCDATGKNCDYSADSESFESEKRVDNTINPFTQVFEELPVFVEDSTASPQVPEIREDADDLSDEIFAPANEESLVEEPAFVRTENIPQDDESDFQSSIVMSPVSVTHQIPLQFCLNYDPDRALIFTDTDENKSIEILKNTYVKNRDGSRTYILSGDLSGKDASSRRATFSPEREMTRVDFAKMLMTANCLEFLSSEELLQTSRLNGQDMPGFYDLPKQTSLKRDGQDGFFANVLYNATFYGLMDGNTENQIEGKRPIYASETIKVLVRLRQFLEGDALTQDANVGHWYDSFYEAATEEGLKLKTLYKAGDEPISRQTAAEELLKVTLLRELYSPDAQQEVEAFLYR